MSDYGVYASRLVLVACALVLQIGCASWVSNFLGFGAPVTKERCEAIDIKDYGFKDGSEARRPRERFESWVADCRAFGVRLNPELYDQGYQQGLAQYCSCENGFKAGVKNQFTEIKGQYFMCSRAAYERFIRGHEAGLEFKNDPRFVNVISSIKVEYFEAKIDQQAVTSCASLPATVADRQKNSVHLGLTVKSERKIAGPKVLVDLIWTNNTAQTILIPDGLIGKGRRPPQDVFRVFQKQVPLGFQPVGDATSPGADFVVLKPGEKIEDQFDLSKAFLWPGSPGSFLIYFEAQVFLQKKTEREPLLVRSDEFTFSFY